jgi:hypothetical protein
MDNRNVVREFSRKFVWNPDRKMFGKEDCWSILEPDETGLYKGDCEDFALTCMFLIENKNISSLAHKLFITKQFKLFRCNTINGESHIVGSIGNQWFDNFSMDVVEGFDDFQKITKHSNFEELSRIQLLLKSYDGIIVRYLGQNRKATILTNSIFYGGIAMYLYVVSKLVMDFVTNHIDHF